MIVFMGSGHFDICNLSQENMSKDGKKGRGSRDAAQKAVGLLLGLVGALNRIEVCLNMQSIIIQMSKVV